MTYDPEKHRRPSIRLRGYDFRQAGAYFVTIVTAQRACFFGDIVGSAMWLNELGEIAEYAWKDLPRRFPYIELDEFVIMPNHVHGIIVLAEGNEALLSDVVRVGARHVLANQLA
jgi:putative transposase